MLGQYERAHRVRSIEHAEPALAYLSVFGMIRAASRRKDGDRSSKVEPQIVILVVAGSNPVGHPIFLLESMMASGLHPGHDTHGTARKYPRPHLSPAPVAG